VAGGRLRNHPIGRKLSRPLRSAAPPPVADIKASVRYSARSRFILESWSGAGGHIGGEDVVGMAVEIFPGSVIAHLQARRRPARQIRMLHCVAL
jgi:hypothetical protein